MYPFVGAVLLSLVSAHIEFYSAFNEGTSPFSQEDVSVYGALTTRQEDQAHVQVQDDFDVVTADSHSPYSLNLDQANGDAVVGDDSAETFNPKYPYPYYVPGKGSKRYYGPYPRYFDRYGREYFPYSKTVALNPNDGGDSGAL